MPFSSYSKLQREMFCPVCQAEYPQEITRCSACDVELVDASPGQPSGDAPPEGNLVLLWEGDDLALHAGLIDELKSAGIPYFNRAIGNYSMRAFPNRFPASAAGPFGFEVSVLSSDFEKAKVILDRIARAS
jgi:predicted amidophosphoribosyltransferase